MKRFIHRHREDIACASVVVVVSILSLYPIFFQNKIPIDANGLTNLPPWAEAHTGDPATAATQELSREALSYYPGYVFLGDAVRNGESLLWNPREFSGSPFFASWQSRCLSVFSIPFFLFSVPTAMQLSAFLKVLVAGACAYYAARRLGLLPPFALAVGVAFQLSAHITLGLDEPLSDVMPWLPLLLLFAERMALGQVHYWPLGAVIGALMLLAGEPGAFWGAALFFSIYLSLRLYARRKTTPISTSALAFAGGIAGAVALSSVQIVPYLELLRHTRESATGSGGAPSLAIVHVGVAQVMLAGLWCAQRHCVALSHRRRVDALLITAAVMIVLALVFGRLLSGMPVLGLLDTAHFLTCIALVLAVAGAFTAEAWLELDPDQCTSSLRRLAVIAPALIVPALILSLIPFGYDGRLGQIAFATLLVVSTAGLILATLFRPSPRLLGYGLVCITALDLFLSFRPLTHFTPRDALFPETPFIQALKDSGGRIGGSTSLGEWPLAGNGLWQARGTGDVRLARYANFIDHTETDPLLLGRASCPSLLLTRKDIQGAFADARPMLHIREVFSSGAVLFDALGIKQRTWMAYETRTVESVGRDTLDSTLPPVVETPILIASTDGPRSAPSIMDTETNVYIPINVRESGPGILVLADAFYPGWKASIDGEPAEVFAVDGAFRGVIIPQTAGLVEFYYDPFSLKLGLGLSCLAMVMIAGGFVVLYARRYLLSRQPAWPTGHGG